MTRRKTLTPRNGEENQEINDIPMIEEKIQNENGLLKPNETEVRVREETHFSDEERLFIDELKALMIRNEKDGYLPFKKVYLRKLRDVTQKVSAVIRHIETGDIAQTNKIVIAAALWVVKEVEGKKGKRGEKKRAGIEKKN